MYLTVLFLTLVLIYALASRGTYLGHDSIWFTPVDMIQPYIATQSTWPATTRRFLPIYCSIMVIVIVIATNNYVLDFVMKHIMTETKVIRLC